jgi:hypothetical protein
MKQVPNQINIRQIVAVQVIRYIIPLGILAKDTFLHAKHKLKFKKSLHSKIKFVATTQN